jgi:hypothetical protein
VTADDVLDMHELLAGFEGNVRALLHAADSGLDGAGRE